ncbi:MAG: hypothetical protein H0W15_01380 [Gemmatimonadales bacterium]|nr:hypothetical protein [Gemmatimonadales bacterium]
MTRFIGFAHHIATSPRGDAARLSWKIPRADSAAVRLVSDETLCHTGQQLLYREAGKQPGSDSRIFMVAIDSVYWIEDPSLMSGEWLFAVVSNSSLDRVLATAAR